MTHTRVIFTTSTSAEGSMVLNTLNFAEQPAMGCHIQLDDPSVKVFIVWGQARYHPALLERLTFRPRIQVHVKSHDRPDLVEHFARAVALTLRSFDPGTDIKVFDPADGQELST
jgi:hypothetical protein